MFLPTLQFYYEFVDILITYFSVLDFTVPSSDISEKRFILLWEPLRVD